MTYKRLKNFLHPAAGIDSDLFIKFLYLLMNRYMDVPDNIPDQCIKAQSKIEQWFLTLAGREKCTPEEDDLINELETAYLWYGMYVGMEFCDMLGKGMCNISDVVGSKRVTGRATKGVILS